MSKISFFTSVYYKDEHKQTKNLLITGIDSYFYLGGKKAQVINLDGLNKKTRKVILIKGNASIFATVLKIASYCTIIIPLGMLIAKAIIRSNYNFIIDKTSSPLDKAYNDFSDDDCKQKTDNSVIDQVPSDKISDPTEKAKNIAAEKIQGLFRDHSKNLKVEQEEARRFQEERRKVELEKNVNKLDEENLKKTGREKEEKGNEIDKIGLPKIDSDSPPSLVYKDIMKKISHNNYNMDKADDFSWVQFKHADKGSVARSSLKFHISIAREEKSLENAFDCIFPILEKYEIASFKILPIEKIEKGGNVLGKEYTIYIQENEEEILGKLLKEIVSSLTKNKVREGSHPLADISIPGGNSFIYARTPNNIFGYYLDAEILTAMGFSGLTLLIDTSAWSNFSISGDNLAQPENHLQVSKSPYAINLERPLNDKEMKIYNSFCLELSQRWKGQFNKIFLLLVGTGRETSYIHHDYEKIVNLTKILFEKNDRVKFGADKIMVIHPNLKINMNFFEKYLKKAAILAAYFQNKREGSIEIRQILPAIYHHCIVPLSKKEQGDLFLSEEEERNLIENIAHCALN